MGQCNTGAEEHKNDLCGTNNFLGDEPWKNPQGKFMCTYDILFLNFV